MGLFQVKSLCLYTCTQPCLPLVNGFVDDALRNTVPGYHALNFIAIDLQLYKIFKIMRVSFFGTQSIFWLV